MMSDTDTKTNILSAAEDMFMQHGYSKVTMEEIASGLGISKKTLYKFFPNKKELLKELMIRRQSEFMDHIEEIWKREDLDFVGKFRNTLDFLGERSSKTNKLQDVRRIAPDIWKEIIDFRRGKSFERIRRLFEAGFETGIFRNDIDKDIVILVYTNAVESIVNPEALSELPCTAGQAIETISKIIFEGILTEEGRSKYIFHKAPVNSAQ